MEQFTTKTSTLRSGHHTGTKVTSAGLCLTETVRGETGRVELDGTVDKGVSADIEFRNEYEKPVVVAYIVTRGGGQSIEARVRDVTSTGCNIFVEEPDDQNHNPEFVSWIVMEEGSHITQNGYRIEAGVHETALSRKEGDTEYEIYEVVFGKIFTTTPAVLHTLNTYNNAAFATTAVKNVGPTKFETVQELAGSKKKSATENIAWIAFEPMAGKGFITDVKGEAGIVEATSATGVDDKPGTTIEFKTGFTGRPDVVVKGQTINGTDGSWARGAGSWSEDLIRVFAEEDQRGDKERAHTAETFGYAAFENDAVLKTIRKTGNRVSEIFSLGTMTIRFPLISTWKVNNFSNMHVEVKVSKDHGINWSDWLPCEYAKQLPGLPISGDLEGYEVQFKYTFDNSVEVPVIMTEFLAATDGSPVIIEGTNVGGYATDGSDWNLKRIL